MTVLSSEACDHLIGSIISVKRKVDLENMSAGFYQPQDSVTLLDLLFSVESHVLHVLVYQIVLSNDTKIMITVRFRSKVFNSTTMLCGSSTPPSQRSQDCLLLEFPGVCQGSPIVLPLKMMSGTKLLMRTWLQRTWLTTP